MLIKDQIGPSFTWGPTLIYVFQISNLDPFTIPNTNPNMNTNTNLHPNNNPNTHPNKTNLNANSNLDGFPIGRLAVLFVSFTVKVVK